MPPETEGLTQKGVLWTVAGVDDAGNDTLNTPVEIDLRLEVGSHETRDAHGNVVAYDGLVTVDREIAEGARLWFGYMEDLPTPNSAITSLYKVARYNAVPDVKGQETYRTIRIVRDSNRLPALA